jgi:hypothetical protein
MDGWRWTKRKRKWQGKGEQPRLEYSHHSARPKGTPPKVTSMRPGSADGQSPPEQTRERRHSNQQHAQAPRSALRPACLSAARPLQLKRACPNRLTSASTRRDVCFRPSAPLHVPSIKSLVRPWARDGIGTIRGAQKRHAPWAPWLKWTGRAWLFRLQYFGPPTDAATQFPWRALSLRPGGA